MNGICIRKEASLDEVKLVNLPEKTDSYMPVPHDYVINYVGNEVADLLSDKFTLKSNKFGLSVDGQCLYGMACFENSNDYLGLNVAYRNSYNKEVALGIAFGAQVFVCENGMLTGDVIVARKHTPNVFQSFQEVVADNIHLANETYEVMEKDVDFMRGKQVKEYQAYQILGVLRGKNVLTPRVFETALKEYNTPSFAEHNDGSLMQVYNACTEGLKNESHPLRAMGQRIKLHKVMKETVFGDLGILMNN